MYPTRLGRWFERTVRVRLAWSSAIEFRSGIEKEQRRDDDPINATVFMRKTSLSVSLHEGPRSSSSFRPTCSTRAPSQRANHPQLPEQDNGPLETRTPGDVPPVILGEGLAVVCGTQASQHGQEEYAKRKPPTNGVARRQTRRVHATHVRMNSA
ncbi:hypothetical protein BIW11_13510 [Tropilaelaps mercedesae]|uniref:Uncharacterized protein n=1 Tax=Tropilaelaps mercedesae TaxID=418985 RepID=A0A1V9X246_9ACAR|nr:hypothetical protein BIW11_13510 [Tropilaelaps mercedesae]